MTLLKVLKARFPFQDQILERGAEVDSRTWPEVSQGKWAQLIDHKYFEPVDQPGGELRRILAERQSAERDRARDVLTNTVVFTEQGAATVPVVETPLVVSTHVCPDCAFVAKSEHGLKVHTGRKHKE